MIEERHLVTTGIGILILFIIGVSLYSFFAPDTIPIEKGPITIKNLDINVLESFPVQVVAVVGGVLPNSCSKIDTIESVRTEKSFTITITRNQPKDAPCADVSSPFTEHIPLDVVDLPKGIYTVIAGDREKTFEFSVDNTLENASEFTIDESGNATLDEI
jgi:hypothetical protein